MGKETSRHRFRFSGFHVEDHGIIWVDGWKLHRRTSASLGSQLYGKYSFICKLFKVPINPKLLFCLNKYMYNSEQNGAKFFDLGQNRNFL